MKIKEKFDWLKQKEETALIVYLTAGFPTLEESMRNLRLISESGADLIEVGVPFSDPIADGPTIQYASQVALEKGVTLKDIVKKIREVKVETPLVFMSYLNPLLAYGEEKLFQDLMEAGISGLIIPDLPVDESQKWVRLSNSCGTDMIFLITPTSPDDRIQLVAEHTSGFIYCVSVTGITGVREGLPTGLLELIAKIKTKTDKPVAVGFGMSNPEQIRMLQGKVEGVIVGSRIVEAIRKKENLEGIVGELKKATQMRA